MKGRSTLIFRWLGWCVGWAFLTTLLMTARVALPQCPALPDEGVLLEWQAIIWPGRVEEWFELIVPNRSQLRPTLWHSTMYDEEGRMVWMGEYCFQHRLLIPLVRVLDSSEGE